MNGIIRGRDIANEDSYESGQGTFHWKLRSEKRKSVTESGEKKIRGIRIEFPDNGKTISR